MPETPVLWKSIGQINTVDTGPGGGLQNFQSVTQLKNGNILVVWESNTNSGAGADAGISIVGQLLDPVGNKIGYELKLSNQNIPEDHQKPNVIALDNGGFALCYEMNEAADDRAVMRDGFDAAGNYLSSQVVALNSNFGGYPLSTRPQMAHSGDGAVMTAYVEDFGNGNQDVRFSLHDLNNPGNAGLSGVTVFDGAAGAGQGIDSLSVASLTNGNFVVAYSDADSATDSDIAFHLYSKAGVSLFDAVTVVSGTTRHDDVSVTALATGGFAVAWTNDGTDVMVKVYNAAGAPVTAAIAVPTTTAGIQSAPSVGALASGNFVVAWIDHDTRDVRAQHVGYNGVKIGSEFVVFDGSLLAGTPGHPLVTGLDDGRFAISFTSQTSVSDSDVLMKIYDARDFSSGGSAGDDVLVGTVGGDIAVLGGNGNDKLYGWDGADILRGDAGADTLYGGDGIDTASYAGSNAGVEIMLLGKSLGHGGHAEGDIITGVENVLGSSFNDTLTGNELANLLTGADGDDQLQGGLGNDTLVGGNGADMLSGKDGADSMAGGAGNDTYVVDQAGDKAIEAQGEGDDRVNSGVTYDLTGQHIEILALTGTGDIDAFGNSKVNQLEGNSGHNRLDGRGGADVMKGGAGNDTYVVDNAADSVIEVAGEGIDLVESAVAYDLTGQAVDNLTLTSNGHVKATGNALDNVLTGNVGDNLIDGGAGADTMKGGAGNDTYVVGTAGDKAFEAAGQGIDLVLSSIGYDIGGQHVDNLTLTGIDNVNATGNGLDNILAGNAGNNIINGGGGADSMQGGAGDDSYVVDNAGDKAFEAVGQGTDRIDSSVSYDLVGQHIEILALTGAANIDATGNSKENALHGNGGHNRLDGRGGADTLSGGAGNDTYVVDHAGDEVFEATGKGTDLVESSVSFDFADQFIENLTLTGTAGIDGTGNGLANTLTGNAGANVLAGLGGADKFVFETVLNAAKADTVADFSVAEGDKLVLDHDVFAGLATGALAANAFQDLALGNVGAKDRIVYDSATGELFFDADGSGATAAIHFATLANHATLLAGDFIIV